MVKKVTESEFKEEKGVVVVDFYADWCGPCKMIAPIIEELSEDLDQVKFLKINVDQERDFAIENNIHHIPTIVIFKDGVELGRRGGFAPKQDLSHWVRQFI